MSNDSYDQWTQGPEQRDRAAKGATQTPPNESSVRLAQVEMMDRWIDGVLAEQRRSRRWKLFFRFLLASVALAGLVLSVYVLFFAASGSGGSGRAHLGLVEINGPIDAEGKASAQRVIEGLHRAWENPNAQMVVLHINSPGGSPVQSQRIFDEVRHLQAQGDKPIVAVIEDIGASGAYYLASAAERIYASPASLVGSIGVISAGFGMQEAIERVGVERRVFTAGENKAFLDPFSPISSDQRQFWQSVLNNTHQQFIDAVKQGRGERLSDDPRLFSGLIWTGEQALELGLIDEIATLEQLSRERLGEINTQDYTPALDPWSLMSNKLTSTAAQWLGLSNGNSPLRYQLP